MREYRPLNLCYLITVLPWRREAETPSDWFRSDSQLKWWVEKKTEAELRSLNRHSFFPGSSKASAGVPQELMYVALWCIDCLGSLNWCCSFLALLTENPTNIQKTTGEEHVGLSYNWGLVKLHSIKTINWRLAKRGEKAKEETELHLRDLTPQLASGDCVFLVL